MSDVALTALFATLTAAFALLAIWSMDRARDDVQRIADLNKRVLRLEHDLFKRLARGESDE